MERTLVNSGDLYQLSEELDWQVCRVPRIPNFKPLKKRSFRLSWGSSKEASDFSGVFLIIKKTIRFKNPVHTFVFLSGINV